MIDLTLSEDSQAIVDAAADLLARAAPVDRLRQHGGDALPAAQLAQWGWFAMGVAAERDGFGLGAGEQALIWTQGGRHLLAPSLLATALAARFGPEDLRAGFQAGTDRAAFVIGGGAGRSHALELEGAAILVGIEAQALSFHRPEAFVGQPVEPLDEALPTRRGALSGPPLASADDGGMAALLVAALLAGTAAAAADLAIAHATTREQFGQPIGAFQAVKHRCADMGVAAFAAEAQVALAAAAIDDGVQEAPLELAAAIVQTADAALANGRGAIQVHGGMGFTDECHAHRFFKRAHVLRQLLGPRLGQAGRLLCGG